MNEEDYASDTDSDDSDFRPDKVEKSDSDSDNIEDNIDGERSSKRKIKNNKSGKNRKEEYSNQAENSQSTTNVNPNDEKRREDELWAAFLGESNPTPQTSKTSVPTTKSGNIPNEVKSILSVQAPNAPSNIFEFAGEEISVAQEQPNILQTSSQNSTSNPPSADKATGIKRPSSGGLSSVLNQISKKNKLSVLQKTKLDWDGFKSTEGINEELQTHNRGKDGYDSNAN
jgi:hypothetical protein